MNYSVLMSVYIKENPIYLKQAMESIRNQTILTDDFVLICDGPLTKDLDNVIDEEKKLFGNILKVYRLKDNSGLGIALNFGLKKCKNELVARMDSDDISKKDRCEKQIKVFTNDQKVSFTSGTVAEFVDNQNNIIGYRKLPLSYEDIINFSKKRNPMNHPCVMFKKSAVLKSGGYNETYHLFEDYYLWVRLLMAGYYAINLNDNLLFMRTSQDIYRRRGGIKYANDMIRFHRWLLNEKWSSIVDFVSGALPHYIICIMPNFLRKLIYGFLH